MNGRWQHPNFNLFQWDELGQNELTLEAREWVHGEKEIDKEALLILAMDLEFCHMVIDNLRNRRFRTRLKRAINRIRRMEAGQL